MTSKAGSVLHTFRYNRGLTLIEVLVVIVLMSLLAGLGGGMYAGSYKRLLVEKAAKGLYVMARYARIAAIEHQRPYHLQLDQENKRYWLVTMEQDPNTLEGVEQIVNNPFCRPGTLASGVNFEAIQIETVAADDPDAQEQASLTFMPNGTAKTATIQVGNGTVHYSIGISSATGKATLMAGDALDIQSLTIDLDMPEL
jgi:prepilin-type N-terminal cleavage/methylation domain-containing protein